MKKNDEFGRGYDLDYYNLYLLHYLKEHRFPEADDDMLIGMRAEAASDAYVYARLSGDDIVSAGEKANEVLLKGFEMSPYDFVSEILMDEFADNISLEDESVEFWTYTMLDELASEFKDVTLSEDYLATTDGAIFRITVVGRISLFFEENGL